MNDHQNRSRRRFLTWMKQITAGASIAATGVGLDLVSSSPAFAASKNTYTGFSPLNPNCTPCPPAGTNAGTACLSASGCVPTHKQFVQYVYTGGCVTNGSCPTEVGSSHCGC